MIEIRKGQAPAALTRQVFGERYRAGFADSGIAVEQAAIARLEDIAWKAYDEGRKAPLTRPAGPALSLLNSEYGRNIHPCKALDEDNAMQQEVRNGARLVVGAVKELRAGRLSQPDKPIKSARPK